MLASKFSATEGQEVFVRRSGGEGRRRSMGWDNGARGQVRRSEFEAKTGARKISTTDRRRSTQPAFERTPAGEGEISVSKFGKSQARSGHFLSQSRRT